MNHLALSPAENAFVDHLIELGDPAAAASITGTQPSLAHDPRVQSALVEQIRSRGALDAVYARKILRELAKSADTDAVRLRAATTLWERGLGKVPDQINVDVSIEHVSRDALYGEIRTLITELGLPPPVDGEFELIDAEPHAPADDREPSAAGAVVDEAPVASPAPSAGSTPAAGTYLPPIPNKWK